jgi:hypothetical protein
MNLLFQVEGRPAAFELGAAMGATGLATVQIELSPVGGAQAGGPLFTAGVTGNGAGADGAGETVAEDGLLAPGQYLLRVWADAADRPGANGVPADAPDATAYYNFTFSVSDAGGSANPPAAVPLPPAALAGGGMLGLLAARRFARRARRAV